MTTVQKVRVIKMMVQLPCTLYRRIDSRPIRDISAQAANLRLARLTQDVFQGTADSVKPVNEIHKTAAKLGVPEKYSSLPVGFDGADSCYGLSRAGMRERILEAAGVFDDAAALKAETKLKTSIIKGIQHPNLHGTIKGGLRGKMFAKADEFRNLAKFKVAGIRTIIDVRAEGPAVTGKLEKACKAHGLHYFNFPVVIGDNSFDDVTIKRLPEFIKLINEGRFMIGCSTGNQRTDIALAMYQCFGPKNAELPIMRGYSSEKGVAYGKIEETLSRIFKQLPEAHKNDIGGVEGFKGRRANLKWYNG